MRITTREIQVNGVVYPMNTPEGELEGLTPGEAVSLASLGYLLDPTATDDAQSDEPENASAEPSGDAAAPPQPAAKASRPPRKRK